MAGKNDPKYTVILDFIFRHIEVARIRGGQDSRCPTSKLSNELARFEVILHKRAI